MRATSSRVGRRGSARLPELETISAAMEPHNRLPRLVGVGRRWQCVPLKGRQAFPGSSLASWLWRGDRGRD